MSCPSFCICICFLIYLKYHWMIFCMLERKFLRMRNVSSHGHVTMGLLSPIALSLPALLVRVFPVPIAVSQDVLRLRSCSCIALRRLRMNRIPRMALEMEFASKRICRHCPRTRSLGLQMPALVCPVPCLIAPCVRPGLSLMRLPMALLVFSIALLVLCLLRAHLALLCVPIALTVPPFCLQVFLTSILASNGDLRPVVDELRSRD